MRRILTNGQHLLRTVHLTFVPGKAPGQRLVGQAKGPGPALGRPFGPNSTHQIWTLDPTQRGTSPPGWVLGFGLHADRPLQYGSYLLPDEEIGGSTGMQLLVKTDDFKKLNVGLSLDEGTFQSHVLPPLISTIPTLRGPKRKRRIPNLLRRKDQMVAQGYMYGKPGSRVQVYRKYCSRTAGRSRLE